MKSFVFRITQNCNKNCPTCCCQKGKKQINPAEFKKKLTQIRIFADEKKELPIIYLTGGEPFLYKATDNQKRKHTIVDIVDLIKTMVPQASIIVKTAGWTKHRLLDELLKRVRLASRDTQIDVRLGFNLFQNEGIDAEERLYHMIRSILKFQKTMKIDALYDKANISNTFKVIEDVLSRFALRPDERFEDMIEKPETGKRFLITLRYNEETSVIHLAREREIILDAWPAYPGLEEKTSDRFWEAELERMCPMIQDGPNHITYDTDLSFYHCNDPFVDYSIPAFPSDLLSSVDEEFAFLEARYARLNVNLKENGLTFRKKRQQCVYCTRFIHAHALD